MWSKVEIGLDCCEIGLNLGQKEKAQLGAGEKRWKMREKRRKNNRKKEKEASCKSAPRARRGALDYLLANVD